MTERFNLTLTDELSNFVRENSGDGSDFTTPTEFIRHMIREKKKQTALQATDEMYNMHISMLDGLEQVKNGKSYKIDEVIQKVG